jgi:hypothetical protein
LKVIWTWKQEQINLFAQKFQKYTKVSWGEKGIKKRGAYG